MKVIWENIESQNARDVGKVHTAEGDIRRAKVIGGWLVVWAGPYGGGGGITFYPDPKHEWDGNSLP